MSAEENKPESSLNDQNQDQEVDEGITLKTILASAVLLLLPALIPLFFLPQAEAGGNVMMLVGLSVTVLVLNIGLLVVLIRWFRSLKEG